MNKRMANEWEWIRWTLGQVIRIEEVDVDHTA